MAQYCTAAATRDSQLSSLNSGQQARQRSNEPAPTGSQQHELPRRAENIGESDAIREVSVVGDAVSPPFELVLGLTSGEQQEAIVRLWKLRDPFEISVRKKKFELYGVINSS